METRANMLERAMERPRALTADARVMLLSTRDEGLVADLFAAARAVRRACCGSAVALRGLIEAGNICSKDCFYCGIRKSNRACARYALSVEEIVKTAEETHARGLHSIVIQSGECEGEAHTAFIEEVLRRLSPLKLGVTLSLGEQSPEVFRRWRAAGAARYLLRIETSSPALYARLHPADHSWERRASCLKSLHDLGYQMGTGVMCGLPGQSFDDLARDIAFFAQVDADMIGMGPYIPHPAAPLASAAVASADARLELGLRMIAVTRLYLHDVNIAAATALQALAPDGRERGLLAGANVLMPNVTPVRCRSGYQLYEGKPQEDEGTEESLEGLRARIARLGLTVADGRQGDSPHYHARMEGRR